MSILFLIIVYLLASFSNIYLKNKLNSALIGIIIFSILYSFVVETYSLIYILNRPFILITNILICLGLIYLHVLKKRNINHYFKESLVSFNSNWKPLSITKKTIFILLGICLILIFFQGVLYPPNNWDSMTYHLPRVIHWLQNHSVLNYPTNITRQIYSPPFSEYLIALSNLSEGSDYFNNAIQWFYYLGLALVVYLILKELNVNKPFLFLSIIFTLTLPEGILESSSTQNDVIHAFFLMCSLYFGIRFIKHFNYFNGIFLGFSAGLALLSKIIAYFYVPPLILVIISPIFITFLKTKQLNLIYKLVSIGVIMLLVNLNFTLRKLHFTHTISGTTKDIEDGMTFNKYGAKLLFSTSIKNICLHADPYFVGNLGNQIAEKVHLIIGQDINEKGTNIFDYKFNVVQNWKNHEDSQPNFIHTILFLISSLVYIYFLFSKKIKLLSFSTMILGIIVLQFLFLNTIIRWEPWNTRIHTPLFAEMIVFMIIIFNQINKQKLIKVILNTCIFICLIYGFFIVVFNHTRPFIQNSKFTSNINLSSSHFDKYFSNQPQVAKEFSVLYKKLLKCTKNTHVGYISHIDGWEYPISMVYLENKKVKTEHIRVNNESKKYTKKYENLDFVFSSYLNQDTIMVGKKIFENQNKNNKHIFVYEKAK